MYWENVQAFFKRQKVVDGVVARLLNEKHLKKKYWVNYYQLEVKPGHIMGAHRGALKAYTPDTFSESPIQFFYHRRTQGDSEGPPTNSVWKRFGA